MMMLKFPNPHLMYKYGDMTRLNFIHYKVFYKDKTSGKSDEALQNEIRDRKRLSGVILNLGMLLSLTNTWLFVNE